MVAPVGAVHWNVSVRVWPAEKLWFSTMTWFLAKSLPNGSARWRSTLTPLAGELPVLVTVAVTDTVPPGWIDVGDAEMFRTANPTPGVDVLWVGHFDLSQSMGIPAQFQHPDFLAALRQVVEAARRHGKHAGMQPGNTEQAAQWMEIGYDVLSWSSDVAVYRHALNAGVAQLRERAAKVAARGA